MRRSAGFRHDFESKAGFVYSALENDGRWVILAGWPDVKIDNKHGDKRPHLHADGIDGEDRRNLRKALRREEAVATIRAQLEKDGKIDPDELERELG